MTNILPANPDSIRQAAAILRRGGLVAFPTETVYGLGADAQNESAVRAMFAAKGRPADHPVIMHLADATLVDEFAAEVPEVARTLAAAFWPGPMTLVFRRKRNVSPLVTGGLDTVGIRVPAHPIAHSLLREFGGAIVAPSANRFGRVSCTSALHVADELGDRADLILDGGDCPIGLESTIVDVSSGQPSILRPGAVTAEDVARVIGTALTGHRSSAPRVSGSLPSHYAPRARLEIVTSEQLEGRARELVAQGCSVGVLTDVPIDLGPRIHNLHVSRNLAELAHDLYETLRRIDRLGCDVALVTLPPEAGLGAALIDRLRRAAGPRDEPA